MNYSSISQFALLIISFAIFFTYTQPTIGDIKSVQDETFAYTDAVSKANEFNTKLNQLQSQMNSFRSSDIEALEIYLPDEVDSLTVMADIETIARQNNVQILSMTKVQSDEASGDVQFEDQLIEQPKVATHDFSVTSTGSYEDMKRMLRNFEQNKYLLEVVSFQFGAITDTAAATVSSADTEENSYVMTLRTYSYAPEVATPVESLEE